MSKSHRYGTKIIGRPRKQFPLEQNRAKSLGGIPMEINKKGKIVYTKYIPNNFVNDSDEESIERGKAILPTGEGSFIRKHIFEVRFRIHPEFEPEDDRYKREYKNWIEKEMKLNESSRC